MSTATTRRIVTQKTEDLHRLANQAESRGIKILLTADGEHFATSTSNPTTLHRVNPKGCDCKGYWAWRRCSHHALLLSQLGAIPDPEPTDTIIDEAPAPCRCGGRGYVQVPTGDRLNDWTAVACGCTQHAA